MSAKTKPEGMDLTVTLTFPADDQEQMARTICDFLDSVQALTKDLAPLWVKLRAAGLTPELHDRMETCIRQFHESKRSHLTLVWDGEQQ